MEKQTENLSFESTTEGRDGGGQRTSRFDANRFTQMAWFRFVDIICNGDNLKLLDRERMNIFEWGSDV